MSSIKVSELAYQIKQKLLKNFNTKLIVEGEITNIGKSTRHLYFSLKDSNALLKCNYWNFFQKENIKLNDGDDVKVYGKLNTYEKGSIYQLTVSKIEKIGMGKLFQDYLKLDEKFKKRGYYDEKNKKRIPTNIKNVGIITGNGASALEDIKDFLITNNFTGKVFIKYAAVQGINCSNDVSQAIKFFDNFKYENDHMDVIILARGGGSTEDLMGFSDKMVIETIFKSKICIISAIGHADDFMLSDKVADIRAITPTNAAEILVTYTSSKIKNFNDTKKFLSNTSLLIIRDKINTYKNLLLNIGNKLSILSDYEKTFRDDKQKALDKIQLNILNKIHNLKTKINKLRNIVNFMNVDKILDEGYAIILKDKTVCADINTLKKKDLIEIKTKDGIIKAIIK